MITRFTALGKVESIETKDLTRSRLVNLNLSIDENTKPLRISAWNEKSDQLAYIKKGQAVTVSGWYAHTKGKEGKVWREYRLTHIYHASPKQAPWAMIAIQGWVSEVGSVVKREDGSCALRFVIMIPDYHQEPQHYECRYYGTEEELRAVAQEVEPNALAFVEGSPGWGKERGAGDDSWYPIINASFVAATGAVTKVVAPTTDTRGYDQAQAAQPAAEPEPNW